MTAFQPTLINTGSNGNNRRWRDGPRVKRTVREVAKKTLKKGLHSKDGWQEEDES